MSFTWIAGACILAVAGFVFGLTGFGISLVSVSLLPFFVPLATVVPLITLYGAAFALVIPYNCGMTSCSPNLYPS